MLTEPINAPASWQTLKPHALAEFIGYGVGIDVEELAAHMKANGYDELEPVVIYEGKILDGRHRHAAAVIAGVVPVFVSFSGTDKQARSIVEKKGRRQHLKAGTLAKFILEVLGKPLVSNDTTKPSRAKAARDAGVSKSTMARKAKEKKKAEESEKDATGDVGKPLVSNDTTSTSGVGKPLVSNDTTSTSGVAPRKEVDDAGFEIPEEAAEAFRLAPELAKMCRELDGLHKRLDESLKGPAGRLIHASIIETIKSARRTLWGARPTHVCPYCRFKGKYRKECNCCKGQGWTNKTTFENAPAEMRKSETEEASRVPF